jgi:hypothetical protein
VHDDDRAHRVVEKLGDGPRVRGSMSEKRMRAPSRTKASAVEVKVNDGTITVSPGRRSRSIADSSSAAVHEVVSSTSEAPVSAWRTSRAFWLNSWLDEVCPLSSDLRT